MDKKEYTLKDGGKFTATSAANLVEQMRTSSMFDESSNNQEYMTAFAVRFEQQEGVALPTTSEHEFVNALVGCGFIQ